MPLFCCLLGEIDAIEAVARACSPRVARQGDDCVIFDASGLGRVLGPPAGIVGEVARLAAGRGLDVRLALAGTATAASLLARARSGISIVDPGTDAEALSLLPLEGLIFIDAWADRSRAGAAALRPEQVLAVLRVWGLRTLGDLARLPRGDVHARLGPIGVGWHRAACGEDAVPMAPAADPVRFVERLQLDWPIDGLEPLSFVLARLCESLAASLERADRGAVTLATTLRLVTREAHVRVLHLPAPMRDARVLRTLILLDLESHPPPAAIDVVDLELGVAPGRIVHGALFTRALPSPEDLATLVARLGALMGETRIGAPIDVDTFDARAVGMRPFAIAGPAHGRLGRGAHPSPGLPIAAVQGFRRYRLPAAASVTIEQGWPVSVALSARSRAGSRVAACAGPWRSSGVWWALDRRAWDRDEWDVQLADGSVYRLACDRTTGRWVVEGAFD